MVYQVTQELKLGFLPLMVETFTLTVHQGAHPLVAEPVWTQALRASYKISGGERNCENMMKESDRPGVSISVCKVGHVIPKVVVYLT